MSDLPSYPPSAEPYGQPTYRAFRLNRDGGIDSAEIIQAATEDEARAVAAKMVNGHGIDLWERARFLESYPPLKG